MVGTQLINAHFSAAIRTVVAAWRGPLSFDEAKHQLSDPAALGQVLVGEVVRSLSQFGVAHTDLIAHAWEAPCIHLVGAFDADVGADTPVDFLPVPDTEATIIARASVIAANAALGSHTISYGTENEGALFVNLVVKPGEGYEAEKSQGSMKGHTDGVWLPVRGEQHPYGMRISPSPDFVCLAGLRNPKQVPTTIMPLRKVLNHLNEDQLHELAKPQYIIGPQFTFKKRLKELFGVDLLVEDSQLLFWVGDSPWIRYSHSSTQTDSEQSLDAKAAMDAFETACKLCVEAYSLAPGDIILVNNRICLHGRAEVGEEHGAKSRWLLRAYGLDTTGFDASQWHKDSSHTLYP
ncbi:Uncharacterized protein ALO46_03273 [Pseudomonas syringae pv. solidagae]|uniref:Uncharacterized protein n=1 Tax=Pseudomonas syringae pv. solidagae TaxID=264458 RepID=A0A0Q0ETQ0_PSESX|nr:Uncharacterized protein ALO46_03273 [Pseudomonas syringae pv. solidagae]RMT34382.1 hypothetical protein ALP49_04095 [Pseudomonas syringae pv. solidagae]RMT39543.1 hypothetical protein ALP48_00345 [Pseudomonas syringae pv. solidagae]